MQKLFVFLLSISINASYSDVFENFDSLSKSSYGDYDYNGFKITNGLCNSSNAYSGNAVRLRNATTSLEYIGADGNGKDGGIDIISFQYRAWDNSPEAVYDVSVNISGSGWQNIGNQLKTKSETYSIWQHSLNNQSDNIIIKIVRISGERLHIDDFSITDYTGTNSANPEPTNYPTNFSATTKAHDKIELTWSDATGNNLPDGYLIIAKTTNNITSPTDKQDPALDDNLSDGYANIKVNQEIQKYVFSNLTASTDYYCKIWPYSNAGIDIDYKTDGAIPASNAKTNAFTTTYDFIINEIHADPHSTNGDANGDGTVNTSEDEFVELFNDEENSVNISGWTLSDITQIRHTFPNNTTINSKTAIVIFGGGNPTGSFGGAMVAKASSNQLGLNNTGDKIILSDGTNEVASYEYGNEANHDQSITRDPDLTGNFVKHSDATGSNGTLFSPGMKINNDKSLPIKLNSFTSKITNGRVVLEWITECEVNVIGYHLNKSINKKDAFFKMDHIIPGNGNCSTKNYYSYVDSLVVPGYTYYYQLVEISSSGATTIHKTTSIYYKESKNRVPESFNLYPAYPNPCNPTSNIRFDITKKTSIKLNIYNIEGKLIRRLSAGIKTPGIYHVLWDGKNNHCHTVANGIYIYQIVSSHGNRKYGKLVLLK